MLRWPAKALWLRSQRGAFPSLDVFPDHVVITSRLIPLSGGLPRNLPIALSFSELTQVRAFDGAVEAQAFLRANTIPEVLQAQEVGQVLGFKAGVSPRPQVAVLPLAAGTNVLLQGPEVFYLLAFDEAGARRLLEAWRGFRGPVGAPA